MLIRRTFRVLMVASAVLPVAGAAMAQMYPGQDVVVDPNAIPRSQLLQPGQPYPGFVLKPPPAHHRTHHRAVAKATTPPPDTATAAADPATPPPDTSVPKDVPPPPPRHKARVTEATPAATPASASSGSAVPFSLGEDEPLGAPATPPPDKTSKPAPTQARVAKAEQPPATVDSSDAAGLAKRGAILFEHSATDPQQSQLDGIKLLAGDLASALEAGATQIQLQAYGGTRGDKSSDARRISLKRALAIRQLLIDNGVPASRIVTRAMGGVTDDGSPDRVDIYIRSI